MTVDISECVHAVADQLEVLRSQSLSGLSVRVAPAVWDAAVARSTMSRLGATFPAHVMSFCGLPVVLDRNMPPGRLVIVTDHGDVAVIVTEEPPTLWERLLG